MSKRRSKTRREGRKTKRDRNRFQKQRPVPKAVLDALADMRHGASMSRAAHDNGVSPRTIKRHVGSALVQDRPGARIRATKADRFLRYLVVPGPYGPMEITVRGSKTASQFANYKAAVNRFLRGDRDAMAAWHGKKIAGIELITAGGTLKSLADKGLLPYSLYRSFSGATR